MRQKQGIILPKSGDEIRDIGEKFAAVKSNSVKRVFNLKNLFLYTFAILIVGSLTLTVGCKVAEIPKPEAPAPTPAPAPEKPAEAPAPPPLPKIHPPVQDLSKKCVACHGAQDPKILWNTTLSCLSCPV